MVFAWFQLIISERIVPRNPMVGRRADKSFNHNKKSNMEKIKVILQNALTQIWKLTKIFAKCVFALWRVLLSIIYFVLCWVFVAITAIIDILADGLNLEVTKEWAGEMQTLEDFVKDLKWFLKGLPEFIKS